MAGEGRRGHRARPPHEGKAPGTSDTQMGKQLDRPMRPRRADLSVRTSEVDCSPKASACLEKLRALVGTI